MRHCSPQVANYVALLSINDKLCGAAVHKLQIRWCCSLQLTNYLVLLSATDKLCVAALHNWQITWCCSPQLTNYVGLLSTSDKLCGAVLNLRQITWCCSLLVANYVVSPLVTWVRVVAALSTSVADVLALMAVRFCIAGDNFCWTLWM